MATNPMLAIKWFGEGGLFQWWQILLLIILIVLIVFWRWYRSKQM
ncbi:MAG: hypothetical protein ACP5HU_06605 [Phycisphaerae bacterium]